MVLSSRRCAAATADEPRASSLLWAEQRPGDVVFVPSGWWHCTLNLETSVALTQNLVLPCDAAGALRELHGTPGEERAVKWLRAARRERHSDS